MGFIIGANFGLYPRKWFIHITNGNGLSRAAVLKHTEDYLCENVVEASWNFALSSTNYNLAGWFIENINDGKVTLWKANLSSEFSLLWDSCPTPGKINKLFCDLRAFTLCQIQHQTILYKKQHRTLLCLDGWTEERALTLVGLLGTGAEGSDHSWSRGGGVGGVWNPWKPCFSWWDLRGNGRVAGEARN